MIPDWEIEILNLFKLQITDIRILGQVGDKKTGEGNVKVYLDPFFLLYFLSSSASFGILVEPTVRFDRISKKKKKKNIVSLRADAADSTLCRVRMPLK